MNERYTGIYVGNCLIIGDNQFGKELSVEEVLNTLNQQENEIKQLKTELKDYHKSNHEYYRDKDKLIRLCERFNIDWKKELEE